MRNIDKRDIEDILMGSKKENRKYLNKILRIKNISSFDIAYIMATLNLNDEIIKLIEYSISKYRKYSEISSNESISEYIFEIVKNIEHLEESSDKLLDEISNCREEARVFKEILNYIIEKNINFLKLKNNISDQNFVFSPAFIDK